MTLQLRQKKEQDRTYQGKLKSLETEAVAANARTQSYKWIGAMQRKGQKGGYGNPTHVCSKQGRVRALSLTIAMFWRMLETKKPRDQKGGGDLGIWMFKGLLKV